MFDNLVIPSLTNISYNRRLSIVIILLAALAVLLVGTSIAAFIYVTRKERVLRKSHLISVIIIILVEVAFLIAVVSCCSIQSKNIQGQILAALLIIISFLALMTLIYFLLEDVLKERIQPYPNDTTISRTVTVEEMKSPNQQESAKPTPSVQADNIAIPISTPPVVASFPRIPTPPLASVSPPPEKPATPCSEPVVPLSLEISALPSPIKAPIQPSDRAVTTISEKLAPSPQEQPPPLPQEKPSSLTQEKVTSSPQEKPVTPVSERKPTAQSSETASAYMINFQKIRQDLLAAIEERTIPALEEAIQQVKDHNCIQLLKYECERALELLNRLMKIEHMKIKVLRLNQATIAELHSYTKPPDEVSTVMRATFLLLGHSEKEVQDWPQIQGILGRFGRESIRRRCYELNPLGIPVDKAREAKDILKHYDLLRVSEISVGLSAFFNWAVTMIDEREKLLESQRRIVR